MTPPDARWRERAEKLVETWLDKEWHTGPDHRYTLLALRVATFAAEVAREERERCARIAETGYGLGSYTSLQVKIAAAIRSGAS